jgi:hypothetical protein
MQMADLDLDGKMEIMVALQMPSGLYVLNAEDGSILWNAPGVNGGYAGYFTRSAISSTILGGRIDGSGVVADTDRDGTPDIFIGVMGYEKDPTTGAIIHLEWNGSTFVERGRTQVWHPCAGGLSMGDTDNDGTPEPDAVRLCQAIENLGPYFVEDLVRSENPEVYRTLRAQVKVPIAVGEQFGDRWDINTLVEGNLIDYCRATVPNVGGITEFLKIAAMCETHYVGLIPHFTGPISEAALVHLCAAFSGPALMEMLPRATAGAPYLPKSFDFRDGKLWPNQRPGLGVEFDASKLTPLAEISERAQPTPIYRRPDGSVTNW